MKKSVLTHIAETLQQYGQQGQDATVALWNNATSQNANKLAYLRRWFLPNRGTVVIVVLLIATRSFWSRGFRSQPPFFPNAIGYQARLTDPDGIPLTGRYKMAFRLYDVPTRGTPLWEEMWTSDNSVEVSDGLVNVMLGSLNNTLPSVIDGHDELYLGVTVGTDSELSPRVWLGSVPYSMQALTVPDGSVTTDKIADGAVTPAKLATVPQRIDCFAPQGSSLFDLTSSGAWSDDLFSCSFTAPSAGFMYLSLQGRQVTNNAVLHCSFSIFVDGVNINTDARDVPSVTYLTNWHPTHMADTVEVEAGTHTLTLSVRLKSQGTNTCGIHDPDINGVFIPTS